MEIWCVRVGVCVHDNGAHIKTVTFFFCYTYIYLYTHIIPSLEFEKKTKKGKNRSSPRLFLFLRHTVALCVPIQ